MDFDVTEDDRGGYNLPIVKSVAQFSDYLKHEYCAQHSSDPLDAMDNNLRRVLYDAKVPSPHFSLSLAPLAPSVAGPFQALFHSLFLNIFSHYLLVRFLIKVKFLMAFLVVDEV